VSHLRFYRLTPLASLTAVLLAIAPVRAVSGQAVFDAKSAAHVRDVYLADLDTLHRKVVALADAIPESKYGWRPATGVRSVSEVLMHVASEWYFFTPRSVAGNPPADFGTPREALPKLETITAKADVLKELDKSWTHCKAELSKADVSKLTGTYEPWKVTIDQAALLMSGDLHEHLGQLIAYARSVGVKPPWSK
jgi:uncharacterized damage-inducible protein DinB